MYSVSEEHGLRIVRGLIPVTDFSALVSAWTEGDDPDDPAYMDGKLADHLNANFVIGPKSVTLALREQWGLA